MNDLHNARIVVTGGTGSFGKAFVRHALKFGPHRLSVFSRDEWKQSEMQKEFSRRDHPCLRYRLGNVRDYKRVCELLSDTDIVVHAAAQKQVPSAEYNPFEAVSTNILGSQNVIRAAIVNGVRKVILLSTDKAVDPINLYGATKMCAERLFVSGNIMSGHKTLCSVVRYGNVFGSRGSVVPLFIKQRETGTVTVTDSGATRFWITLDQAVALVEYAIGNMLGGEIFVPIIPSATMQSLARAVAPDAEIKVIGMRIGEKRHESLISRFEDGQVVKVGSRYVILPKHYWFDSKMRCIWHNRSSEKTFDPLAYSSDVNERMTVDALREMLKKHEEKTA